MTEAATAGEFRRIPVARLAPSPMNAERANGLRCDGCKHCAYIAPGGELWRGDPQPVMNCRLFGKLPVVATKHGDYAYTPSIPAGCPTHAQRDLFA